jgi:hypothetical protein
MCGWVITGRVVVCVWLRVTLGTWHGTTAISCRPTFGAWTGA